MSQPKQPDDHPSVEEQPDPSPGAPNGIPAGDAKLEPKGRPTSDRQATETAASPELHKPD